jgi:hypothetical protein
VLFRSNGNGIITDIGYGDNSDYRYGVGDDDGCGYGDDHILFRHYYNKVNVYISYNIPTKVLNYCNIIFKKFK